MELETFDKVLNCKDEKLWGEKLLDGCQDTFTSFKKDEKILLFKTFKDRPLVWQRHLVEALGEKYLMPEEIAFALKAARSQDEILFFDCLKALKLNIKYIAKTEKDYLISRMNEYENRNINAKYIKLIKGRYFKN